MPGTRPEDVWSAAQPPTAVGPGPDAGSHAPARDADAPSPAASAAPRDGRDVALLGLIDRLAVLLDRSDLSELEVGSGGTDIVLRKPSALPTTLTVGASVGTGAGTGAATAGAEGAVASPGATVAADGGAPAAPERPSVKAPLTGIFYASPAPGSAPYVAIGREVAVGQVIGLIEAMKLFNEIKSDLAGRVVRVLPDSGTLVKAKQPLIEVEPL